MDKKKLTADVALRIIKSRKLITSVGKYTAQVINKPNYHEDKVIINLKATTTKLVEEAKQSFRDGEFNKAANSNLSYGTFADTGYVPSQGEYVSIMVDFVTNRKDEQVLAVVGLNEIQARTTSNVDLGDEFDNLLEESISDTAADGTPELD